MGPKKGEISKPPTRLGRWMARLPAGKLLYPLYLAKQLDTVEERYASTLLPEAFEGLKLAYVSDIHYGVLLEKDRVRNVMERLNAMDADVVILGGDYGQDAKTSMEFFQIAPGFHAREGVIGAIGNHDGAAPKERAGVMEAMRRAGVTPLVNDVWRLRRAEKTIAFAATDDFRGGQPDLEKVSAQCQGADFIIFCPHSPDILPDAYRLPGGPFFQLAICGHTHGGQVALFGHAIKSSSIYGDRYRSGWYREAGVDILVSNGVGTSGLPVRLGARPQIHKLTLTRKNREADKEER